MCLLDVFGKVKYELCTTIIKSLHAWIIPIKSYNTPHLYLSASRRRTVPSSFGSYNFSRPGPPSLIKVMRPFLWRVLSSVASLSVWSLIGSCQAAPEFNYSLLVSEYHYVTQMPISMQIMVRKIFFNPFFDVLKSITTIVWRMSTPSKFFLPEIKIIIMLRILLNRKNISVTCS